MNGSMLTASLIFVVFGIYILYTRLDRIVQRLDELDSKIGDSAKQAEHIEYLERSVWKVSEMVELGLPARVRDRLAFRGAKQLTLADIRSWIPGSVMRLIEADWDIDHEAPMISCYDFCYDFRFRAIDETPEGKLGHCVRGEWRFSSSEEWKEHFFRASGDTADVRLLG